MKRFFLYTLTLFGVVFNCAAGQYWFNNNPDADDPNDWSDAVNWSGGVVPTVSDWAIFSGNGLICNITTEQSIRQCECPQFGYDVHVTVKNGGHLTVSGPSAYRRGYLYIGESASTAVFDVEEGGIISFDPNPNLVADPALEVAAAGDYSDRDPLEPDVVMNIQGTVDMGEFNGNIWLSYGMLDDRGNGSNGVINVMGNGRLLNFGQMMIGLLTTVNYGTLNIDGENALVTGCTVYPGDHGIGTITVHDGLLDCAAMVSSFGLPDPETGQVFSRGTVTISGNGRIFLSSRYPERGGIMPGTYIMSSLEGAGPATLDIIDSNSMLRCDQLVAGMGGAATINIEDGLLDCNSLLLTSFNVSSYASCQINLFGGTINVRQSWQPGYNSKRYYNEPTGGRDNAHLDIRNTGRLVVPYAQLVDVVEDVNLGIIKAYDGAGSVIIDADEQAGIVVVTACMQGDSTILGDITNDCKVNFEDLEIFAADWLLSPPSISDLNNDGKINLIDFSFIASNWLFGEN